MKHEHLTSIKSRGCKTVLYFCAGLFFVAQGLFADTAGSHISSGSTEYQADLGVGYDNNRQILKGKCLDGRMISQGISRATLDFRQTISYEQLSRELGFGASGRARFGMVSASASAKFMSNAKSDTYSITAVYSGDYEFKNQLLENEEVTRQMRPHLEHDERWEQACGFEYVQQLKLGAKIYFTIRIDFASEAEKRAFAANFNISGPLFAASAHLRTAMAHFSKRTQVTISVLQIGGDVSKASDIFGNAENVVKCSLGEFDVCGTVLSSALRYATREFPTQINDEAMRRRDSTGPVVLAYLTKPYSAAGIFRRNSPELTREVRRQRTRLDQLLTEHHAQWVYANRYGTSGSRRLSPRQNERIDAVKITLDENIRKIVDAAQECYDHPNQQCITAGNELNAGAEHALRTIDRTAFIIENETFAQFCDDGLSPSPYFPNTLKESVQGLIALAREMRREAFLPPAPGLAIDECFIAGTIFLQARTLNASRRNISDLRPLIEFTQLENLDLSGNQIADLTPLATPVDANHRGFTRLRVLNLSQNRIRSLEGLRLLSSLERLYLNNNQIIEAEPLRRIPTLQHVDLRNNNQELRFQLPPPAVVLLADHGSGLLFAGITRAGVRVSRFASQSAPLGNNRVLITGGVEVEGASVGSELFDMATGLFRRYSPTRDTRQWHTMTVLRDGRVLVAGGSRSRTLEMFEPQSSSFRGLYSRFASARGGHTATLLNDGRVLFTGGWAGINQTMVNLSAEIFDPETERLTVLQRGLSVPRAAHTATLLSDGKVLLAGGINDNLAANSADLFDPQTNEIRPLPFRMQMTRGRHTATRMSDGKVFLAGGTTGEEALDTAEIYNPTTQRFELLSATLRQKRFGHSAATLSSGVIALIGGSTNIERIDHDLACRSCTRSVEIFDPETRDFTPSNQEMSAPRVFHAISELRPNQFLITGGLGADAHDSAEIMTYTPPVGPSATTAGRP